MKNPYLNAVSFRYVLLDCYKRIGLTEEETIVVLMIDHLLEQGNTFINSITLKFYQSAEQKKILNMLGLSKKNIIF